jgi:hypothetical protein
MSEEAGAHLDEEPQSERGEPGSRDTGSDEPAGGPADRPEGKADDESTRADTAVDPQSAQDPEAPDLPSGTG